MRRPEIESSWFDTLTEFEISHTSEKGTPMPCWFLEGVHCRLGTINALARRGMLFEWVLTSRCVWYPLMVERVVPQLAATLLSRAVAMLIILFTLGLCLKSLAFSPLFVAVSQSDWCQWLRDHHLNKRCHGSITGMYICWETRFTRIEDVVNAHVEPLLF